MTAHSSEMPAAGIAYPTFGAGEAIIGLDGSQGLIGSHGDITSPTTAWALHRLMAQVYVKQGRMKEAREKLLTAVECDRWDWRARNDLGVVCTNLDRFSDGIASLEYALWINPKGQGIETNLQNLRDRMGLKVK